MPNRPQMVGPLRGRGEGREDEGERVLTPSQIELAEASALLEEARRRHVTIADPSPPRGPLAPIVLLHPDSWDTIVARIAALERETHPVREKRWTETSSNVVKLSDDSATSTNGASASG